MSFPKVLFLILFSILAATTVGTTASLGDDSGSVPQRLRVRVENQRLRTGDTTKVIVEFLDRNYGQVANDATRVIALGQASSRSRAGTSGSGEFDQAKLVVKPGAWSGEASFKSSVPGRLFITANSEGLEPGQALVLVASSNSVSLLNKFVSLFETVAHAQDEDNGFEIFPKSASATADGRHRATFNVSFLASPAARTVVRITTNLTNGGILYNGQRVGGAIADIPINEGEAISGEIAVYSAQHGKIEIAAQVRPNGPADQASVDFMPPRPAQILFDADPLTIGSDAADIPLTVRFGDDGGFPIEPDQERTIRFSRATASDQVSFEPESVVLKPGQASAQVVVRLQQLPQGNELKLLAKTDQGIRAGLKTLVIKSAIEKLLITGPNEVYCGGDECEFAIYLLDKDGQHRPADWDRYVDLNVSGGVLNVNGSLVSAGQVVIPRGARSAVVKYLSAHNTGKYLLTASSGGIGEGTYNIGVINKGYLLAMFALLGGVIGAVARQVHKDKKFGRILPRWTGKYWDLGFVGRLAGSLVGALFFYWTFKLGLSQALGSPVLPVALDLGTKTVALFLGGIGGFAGTIVLDKLTKWFLPGGDAKSQTAPAQ
jgi:hypothetical protein